MGRVGRLEEFLLLFRLIVKGFSFISGISLGGVIFGQSNFLHIC